MEKNHFKNEDISSSFRTAWKGIWTVLIHEPSFKYMMIVALAVIGAMIYLPTSRDEKAVLLVMIFSVLILELINSAMERFLDFLQPADDPRVRIIKDLLAAIVLVVSLAAIVIGVLVFWPHLKTVFS
ncbi:MAG: diacylglycerol kinase family protein [Candidatus Paceibacterota bacterium]